LLDAPTIVTLLGNPTPFLLAAQGPNTISIYSTRQPLSNNEKAVLNSFPDSIRALAGRTVAALGITPTPAKPFSVELTIPHATALGDLATRINGLNNSQFTIQDVSSDRIRVTAPTTPDCDTWKGFLTDIRRMEWQLISEPMSAKLFYLSSSDVAAAFTSLGGAAPSTPAPTTPPAPTPSATTPPTSPAPTSPPASTPPAPTTSPVPTTPIPVTPPTVPSTTAAGSGSATIAVTQPPGSNITITSDTTPCVVAGLAFGTSNACGSASAASPPAGGASSPATPATPTPKAPLAMASVAVAMAGGEQTPPDLLVFSDTNPGDDAQVQERNRIIAQLDLPRPEMIISAWVTQNSSASSQAMGAFINLIKGMVAEYDREFERVVLRGWESVKTQSASPEYFNEPFRSYVADRFVADTFQESKPGSNVQDLSQAFLDHSQAKLADPVAPGKRTNLGICERGRYCLGYNNLFNPVKPALTDLLLNIIAAQDPVSVADNTIAFIEGHAPAVAVPLAPSELACDGPDPESQRRCHAIWRNLDLDRVSPPPGPATCSERDYRGILYTLFLNPAEPEPRVHLQCFKEAADRLLAPGAASPPYAAGLMRAVIADFLFNYKMSQQYPHEFAAYDLTHSADALNAALSPLIDAFNRDLWSFQLLVRADMQYRVERLNSLRDQRGGIKRLFGVDKPSFFNDGLITVRTISGQSTYVNTTSQSFLNASTAPELNTLLSSLTASGSAAPGSNSLAGAVFSANPLSRFTALAGALSNYQTTFAQIGRGLQLSAIPRSLTAASSAEIAVTLNADESAGGPTYTGGGASDPALNTSRVASHDTTTRVRVDSVKLFEISSLTAIVERSRARFPLLPPFVEIPYIGTILGIPLPAAKEYHSSTAILSAYVVPTAADIAYGLRFVSDLVVDGLNPGLCSFFKGAAGPSVTDTCIFRRALSLRDLANQPVMNFNKEMIRCLANNNAVSGCLSVSFDGVPNTNWP
jgi:hypothetical protein